MSYLIGLSITRSGPPIVRRFLLFFEPFPDEVRSGPPNHPTSPEFFQHPAAFAFFKIDEEPNLHSLGVPQHQWIDPRLVFQLLENQITLLLPFVVPAVGRRLQPALVRGCGAGRFGTPAGGFAFHSIGSPGILSLACPQRTIAKRRQPARVRDAGAAGHGADCPLISSCIRSSTPTLEPQN